MLSVSPVRLRFVPDSSYIQTVKVQSIYCRAGQREEHVRVYPIIPVRFLFCTIYPAAHLYSCYANLFRISLKLSWKKSLSSPQLCHFCSTFQHKDNEIFTKITQTFLKELFFLNYYKKTDLPRLISTTEFLLQQLCGIVGAVITVKVPTKTPHYAIKDLTLLPHQISTLEKSHP